MEQMNLQQKLFAFNFFISSMKTQYCHCFLGALKLLGSRTQDSFKLAERGLQRRKSCNVQNRKFLKQKGGIYQKVKVKVEPGLIIK